MVQAGTTLDTQSGHTTWSKKGYREFLLNNETSYKYYKMVVTDYNKGSSLGYAGGMIGELDLLEDIYKNAKSGYTTSFNQGKLKEYYDSGNPILYSSENITASKDALKTIYNQNKTNILSWVSEQKATTTNE